MRKFQVMFRYCFCLNDNFYGYEHRFDTKVICIEEGEKANSNAFNEKLKEVILESQKYPEVMSWSLIEEE